MGGYSQISAFSLICLHLLAQKPDSPDLGIPDAGGGLPVRVTVYNGLNLSSSDLSSAEQEATRIFRYAGVQLVWTTGLMGGEVSDTTPVQSLAVLQLRIWSSAMAGRRPTSAETLGFCLSLENGDAVVLADVIEKRAAFGTTNFTRLLGLAMTHELGHLLLQSARHSVKGIMRSRWTERALMDDDRGYLRFSSGEAEMMRIKLAQRVGLK